MDELERRARLHDEENREELAIRKEERELADSNRKLERDMEEFEAAEERAERQIEEEWRRENWGRDLERPPRWPNHRR